MTNEMMISRHCAFCGSDKGSITPQTIMVDWAIEKGIKMKVPTSRYLHLGCVRRVRTLVTRAVRAGE